MASEIAWLLEMEIKEGRRQDLEALIGDLTENTEANEPGTTGYVWWINDEGTLGHLFERYVDSEAALVHLETFSERFADRYMPLVGALRVWFYGTPSPELERAMAVMKPLYMRRAGGFTRPGG